MKQWEYLELNWLDADGVLFGYAPIDPGVVDDYVENGWRVVAIQRFDVSDPHAGGIETVVFKR